MDDQTLGGVLALVALFVGITIYVFARWQDPVQRCKWKRKWLKQNTHVLYITDKEGKTINARTVNVEKDCINVDNELWVIVGSRVYRKDNTSQGTTIKRKNIRYEEGAPTIYVDRDSIKPLDFYEDSSKVKPEEIGATLNAYVFNQLAKGIAGIANQKTFMMIILIASLASVGLNLYLVKTISEMGDQLTSIKNAISGSSIIPKGGTLANGTIYVTQGG